MEKKSKGKKKLDPNRNLTPKASGNKIESAESMFREKEQSTSNPMNLIPANSFLETFKYRQFARNYIKFDQNLVLAYKATFGDNGENIKKIVQKAAGILAQSTVQIELQKLLPSDRELVDVVRAAIAAPVPSLISWSEKHKFWESAMELKGHINKKEQSNVTNNVVMFVKE